VPQAENSGPSGAPEGPYRFLGLVATSWRFYSARFRPLVLLFALLGLLILVFPLVGLLDMPEQVDIAVSLFTAYAMPAIIASYGVAVAAAILDRYLADQEIGVGEARRQLRPDLKNLLSAALLSGMIGLLSVTILGPLGFILLPLFFGPPMLMQVVALERLPVAEAWARTRALMRGHWARVLTYLLTITMGTGLLGASAVGLTLNVLDGSGDVSRAIGYSIVTVLFVALTYPFIATAQFIAYADIAALVAEAAESPRKVKYERTLEAEVVKREEAGEARLPADHYEALGIKRHATQKQIRRAHAARMKILDPERHPTAGEATRARMDEMRHRADEAYEVLSDPDRRAVYDAGLDG
jgi:hypothetical protein